MSYAIIEIEVTQPLPTLFVPENGTGLALILRSRDKAIGFLMKALPAKSVLTPGDLAEMINQEVGNQLLHEGIDEELVSPVNRHQFPSLTVAICTKDRPVSLNRCLQSLLKLRKPNSGEFFQFEVLIVENASSNEKTKELLASLSGVRYVQEPKPGLDFARNRAVQEATGEIIAFIDDDVVVDRKWLDGLMEAWFENPDAAAFTGQVLPYELATDAQILVEQMGGFRRGFKKIRYGQTNTNDDLYPCTTVFGNGCNMAFRREVLLKLGGFDDALDTGAALPGGGDLDILYRIIRAGYPLVYEPQYLVFHHHRREYKQLRNQICGSWGTGLMAFLVKTYRHDSSERLKVGRFIKWWLKDLLRQLLKSLWGSHLLPADMVLAELWGAVLGLLGGYSRSVRRINRIRRQFS